MPKRQPSRGKTPTPRKPRNSRPARPIAPQRRTLLDSERKFSLLVENVTDYAIYMLDPNGIVTNWNPGAQRFKGYKPDEIVGEHFERFFTDEDRANGVPAKILETAERDGRFETEALRVRKDGTRFWANAVIDTIRDENGKLLGFAKITRDVSERKRNEEHLKRLAHFDSLTELPNRVSLRSAVENAVASLRAATVMMIDLDGFKQVNDTLGHTVGDALLKAAGARIKSCVGDKGCVGRLGGDEFAVLLPNLGDPTAAGQLCELLIDAFRAPFFSENQECYLGLGIGFAISPSHGSSAEELLTNADLALYRAKTERKRGYCMFEPSFRHTALANRLCEQELRQAVAEGGLELFYQPQVNLFDYRVTGVEALLRWRHPERGLLAPAAFLHVLERGPLASQVGDWVIREATAQAGRIRDLGIANFRMAVNLFGSQLRRGQLVSTVTKALEDNALPPNALELEITENIFLQDDTELTAPLRVLNALGVGVAFDDYGTGYASLSLLKRFPLSRLKIDKNFVRNLCTDAEDAAVVRAVVYLAESFGLEVIAEGVETEEQRVRLRELGCERGQGYLFGRPMPVTRMFELFAGGSHDGVARWPRPPQDQALSRSSTSSEISKFA